MNLKYPDVSTKVNVFIVFLNNNKKYVMIDITNASFIFQFSIPVEKKKKEKGISTNKLHQLQVSTMFIAYY